MERCFYPITLHSEAQENMFTSAQRALIGLGEDYWTELGPLELSNSYILESSHDDIVAQPFHERTGPEASLP